MLTHMPESELPVIEKVVDRLCDDYKSHAYQIARKEARALGLPVIDASPELEATLVDLLKLYSARQPFPGTPPTSGRVKATIAWLDSTAADFRVDAEFEVAKPGELKLVGDAWRPY